MGETSLKSAYEEDDLEAEEDLADKIAQLIKDYSHFFVSVKANIPKFEKKIWRVLTC